MRKMKKVFALLLIIAMSAMMLVGCGEPKTTPEESAKIFLDVLLKNDKTDIDKIGMNEEGYTEFRKVLEEGMMEGFSNTGVDNSILTDEVKNAFKDSMLTGLTKLEYEVVSSSEDKNIAKVEVKIKGFDMNKISAESQKKLQAEFTKNPAMTQAEMFQSSFKHVGEGIAAGIIVPEPNSINLTLTKENNIWLPGENDIIALMTVIVAR